MKKILLSLLLIFNLNIFGKMTAHPSRVFDTQNFVSGKFQRINYETSNTKVTGLGGVDELFYDIESYGADFINSSTGKVENSIKIQSLEIVCSDGIVDKNNKIIKGFNGKLNFKVKAIVTIRSNNYLSGRYITSGLVLKLKNSKNSNEELGIDLVLELNVIKGIKVKTTPMNLGVGIQGEIFSSKNGSDGFLEIEGESNRIVLVSYQNKLELFQKNGMGKMEVQVFSPELEKIGPEEYKTILNNNGENKIKFIGEAKNTKNIPPGEYRGNLEIKVRYD